MAEIIAMPVTTNLSWDALALYDMGGAPILILLFNIPYVGRALRALFSFAILAFAIFLVLQQAPLDPGLSRVTAALDIERQQVSGEELRIPMAATGISGSMPRPGPRRSACW
ncbi:hypothetical protein [Sphingopyxis sp. PAMC25046]|uniref:hypothetical protein n=1 Tax=Sphingopyxis sp. PAMC25046 TaxID=2565556 RepID=UPI001FF75476|nr:hypothetical protein [Sphingopyxis sp. PAMC25046]